MLKELLLDLGVGRRGVFVEKLRDDVPASRREALHDQFGLSFLAGYVPDAEHHLGSEEPGVGVLCVELPYVQGLLGGGGGDMTCLFRRGCFGDVQIGHLRWVTSIGLLL